MGNQVPRNKQRILSCLQVTGTDPILEEEAREVQMAHCMKLKTFWGGQHSHCHVGVGEFSGNVC